jgi:hypothetical protein
MARPPIPRFLFAIIEAMRTPACFLLALCVGILHTQRSIPNIEGETLAGKKVLLPRDLGNKAALLIIGFTHGSQAQTKAWGIRVHDRFPMWSIAVLEDVPHLLRGVVSHSIKSGIPKQLYDRFLLVYHGEKELKQFAGFDRSDDAYLLVIDSAGAVRWRFHGSVTDAAVEEIGRQLDRTRTIGRALSSNFGSYAA